MFLQNAVGSLFSAPLLICGWWLVAALATGPLEPRPSALIDMFPLSHVPDFLSLSPLPQALLVSLIPLGWNFLLLFHTARCTLSYAVYILREIIDHAGLPATSVLAFTRTSPCCTLLQRFLQPHDDNYHLLHHLLPRVPMNRLHACHVWLCANVPEYEHANREWAPQWDGVE